MVTQNLISGCTCKVCPHIFDKIPPCIELAIFFFFESTIELAIINDI